MILWSSVWCLISLFNTNSCMFMISEISSVLGWVMRKINETQNIRKPLWWNGMVPWVCRCVCESWFLFFFFFSWGNFWWSGLTDTEQMGDYVDGCCGSDRVWFCLHKDKKTKMFVYSVGNTLLKKTEYLWWWPYVYVIYLENH